MHRPIDDPNAAMRNFQLQRLNQRPIGFRVVNHLGTCGKRHETVQDAIKAVVEATKLIDEETGTEAADDWVWWPQPSGWEGNNRTLGICLTVQPTNQA